MIGSTSKQLESYVSDVAAQRAQLGCSRDFSKIRQLAAELGLTRVANKQVVVAGTNGKGTTVAYLQQLLMNQGLVVGTTTSPHIHEYTERIACNGVAVDAQECLRALLTIERQSPDCVLTYFDLTTLAALHLFKQWEVDVAIVEAGLGGRLDCANVVDSDVAILTNVDLDHCDILGTTIEAISEEKVRVARASKPLVFADSRSNEVVEAFTVERDIPLFRIDREFGFNADEDVFLTQNNERICVGTIVSDGADQASLATAVQTTALLMESTDIEWELDSLRRPPGRIERISAYDRDWILDIAHNPAGIRYLLQQLTFRGVTECCIVFAAFKDKDVKGMLNALNRTENCGQISVTSLVITETIGARALPVNAKKYGSFCDRNSVHVESDLSCALVHAQSLAADHEPIVVLGSVDLVSRTRELLRRTQAE